MAQRNLNEVSAEQLYEIVKKFMFGQIKSFCQQTNHKPSTSLHFIDDLDFSHLDIAMLLYDVEQEFNISFSDENVETVSTVEEFINIIIKLLTKITD